MSEQIEEVAVSIAEKAEKPQMTAEQIKHFVTEELTNRYNAVGEFLSSMKPDVDIKAHALRALHESFLWAKEFVFLTEFKEASPEQRAAHEAKKEEENQDGAS